MSVAGILENVVSNLLSAFVVGIVAYLILYIRMSGVTQSVRRLIHPNERVLFLDNKSYEEIRKSDVSPFHSPITKHERNLLVGFYGRRNGSNPRNGSCVRLDKIVETNNKTHLEISLVDFYDFIATNLTVYPAYAPIRSFRRQIATMIRSFRLFTTMDQVTGEVKKYGSPEKVTDVLQNRALANIVAISVLMIDSEGKIGIVKRTKNVAISSGSFGMACAGTVNEQDFLTEDPFLSCALREVQEECNIELQQIHFDGIVVPKQKMQPIFLYHVRLDKTWEELHPEMKQAKDYAFETESLYAVPVEHSVQFAAQARMTDTAAYQIWQYASSKGHSTHWYVDMIKPLKKDAFLCRGG